MSYFQEGGFKMGSIKSENHKGSINGNNGCYDYEAMIKGLISLCKDDEMIVCID